MYPQGRRGRFRVTLGGVPGSDGRLPRRWRLLPGVVHFVPGAWRTRQFRPRTREVVAGFALVRWYFRDMINRSHEAKRPRAAQGRPRWVLLKLARFARTRGWWPSAPELRFFSGCRGSDLTWFRDLAALRAGQLVELVGRRWRLTEDGFAFVGLPIVQAAARPPWAKPLTKKAKRERKLRRQADTLAVLDAPVGEAD